MSARTILKVKITTDEEGALTVKLDTEQDPRVVVALLEQVIEQIGAPQDRATAVEAFGATRRRV